MKSSDSINSRFASTIKDAKIFFSSCLSMHMVPVLFALMLIIVAERKANSGKAKTEEAAIVESPVKATGSIANYMLLNPTNMTQVFEVYKASQVVLKSIH